jgi:hypothetical protein
MNFKIGDKVEVKYGYGWNGTGEIVRKYPEGLCGVTYIVRYDNSKREGGFGERFLTLATPTLGGFNIGDKAFAPGRAFYENPCTVTKISKEFVYLTTDTAPIVTGGFYPRNVKLIAPAKTEVVSAKSKAYVVAKTMAINLAKRNGYVNADQVQQEIAALGYKSTDLGNAAGVLFRGKNWEKVGTVKSARKGNHFRTIVNWKYVGA